MDAPLSILSVEPEGAVQGRGGGGERVGGVAALSLLLGHGRAVHTVYDAGSPQRTPAVPAGSASR